MKAITTIITIMLFVLSNNSTQAQIPVTRDILKSKIWVLNEGLKATMRITDTEIIYYVEDEALGSQKYHLSDKNCIDASFYSAKVGMITTGKYIFYEKGCCAYIEFINPSEFKMGTYCSPTDFNWIVVVAKP